MTFATFTRPRMRLLANGTPFRVIDAEISLHGYYGAGRFTAEISAYDDPAHGPAWWAGKDTYDIELQGGLLPPGAPETAVPWVSVFQGTADDDLEIKLDKGTISLQGRDYSSKLIDAKTAETFSNQTLAQIATTLAGRVGLTAKATSGPQLAGQFYEIDHARTAHDTHSKASTYWELITYLAQQQGYDVWVDGKVLNVAPKDAASDNGPTVTVQSGQAKISGSVSFGRSAMVADLTLMRRPALAKDVQVTVKSWGAKGKAVVTGKDGPDAADQKIVRTFPNLSAGDCTALARKIRADLGRHERNITYSAPGDFTVRPRQSVTLQGTGTAFDAKFFISEVTTQFGTSAGLWQSIRARNLPPQSDQSTP